jgi:6,7-dimethyl-8-ribityllumazine synthase
MQKNKLKFKNIRKVKGSFIATGKKFGVVVSQFNELLTDKLLEGALDTLLRHGAREKDIRVIYVPGAFELPLAVQKLVARKDLNAIIALAVVIRGKTKHFDQVVTESARGIQAISLKSQIPVILGMIPAETIRDAEERIGWHQANE